jgi:Cu/Ag efflux protein CusF
MNRSFCVVLLAASLWATGCSSDAQGPVHGNVVAVDASRGEVTLDHEEIPGLMMAMTMTYPADPALLAGIAAGQEVDFRVREEAPGRYVVTEIAPR